MDDKTHLRHRQSARSQLTLAEKPTAFNPEPARPDATAICPTCKGAGWLRSDVPFGHPLFGKAGDVRCHCRIAENTRKLQERTFSQWGENEALVREMEAQTFASFDQHANGPGIEKAYYQARNYASALIKQTMGQRSCLLIGPCGTGKTHLGCAIINAVRKAGIGCLFINASDFFPQLYAARFQEDVLQKMIETPLLLLDDLDKMQSITDGSFQRQTLHMLFNQRYNSRRPIIITANKDDGWDQWLDKATRSRLFYGYAKADAISMQGQDYRMMRALNFPSTRSHHAGKRNQEER